MVLPFSRLDFNHPMNTSSAFFEKAEASKPMPGKRKSNRSVGTGEAEGLSPHQYFLEKRPKVYSATEGFGTVRRITITKNILSPTNI